jgi:DNA polymerase-3 subunit epsilon
VSLLGGLLPWSDPRLARPPAEGRWVVVDVETSGLNPLRDSLIAVGALAVRDGEIDLADSFEVVLRQDRPSTGDNIEVHGIGGTEQLAGDDPAAALRRFLDFVADDPLVAFHAPFDAMVLRRALRERLGRGFRRRWLDLADVSPLAWPGRVKGGLDAWLQALAIPMAYRHRAIVDCLGTAQLFLAVLAEAPRLEARSARSLLALSAGERWLG